MSSLFGVELPTPVNFVIAFIVVLVLIGAATWLVRRFGATRLDAAGRGRQPRLAVVDATAIDGRRKLVIIRRDNAEHLLMIGGPTDVVVETNIVRSGQAAVRETAAAPRTTGIEAMPRAMPLPDPTPWPLQPEPVPAPIAAPVVRLEPPAPAVRLSVDDLSPRPAPAPVPPPPPVVEPVTAPAIAAARARPAETLAGLAAELARPIPEVVAIPRPTRPEPARTAPPQPVPAPQAEAPGAAPDQNLAEMAQRLEAALRRPVGQPPAPKAAADGAARPASPEVKLAPRPAAAPAATPAKPDAQPRPQLKNIEQEMANLLGRPGKT